MSELIAWNGNINPEKVSLYLEAHKDAIWRGHLYKWKEFRELSERMKVEAEEHYEKMYLRELTLFKGGVIELEEGCNPKD